MMDPPETGEGVRIPSSASDIEREKLRAAVDAFADKMKAKLLRKEREGYEGWDGISPYRLADKLWAHLKKGDLVDVANFCMMLSHQGHGAKLTFKFEPTGKGKP